MNNLERYRLIKATTALENQDELSKEAALRAFGKGLFKGTPPLLVGNALKQAQKPGIAQRAQQYLPKTPLQANAQQYGSKLHNNIKGFVAPEKAFMQQATHTSPVHNALDTAAQSGDLNMLRQLGVDPNAMMRTQNQALNNNPINNSLLSMKRYLRGLAQDGADMTGGFRDLFANRGMKTGIPAGQMTNIL